MQERTEEAEAASIPRDGPNLNRTFTVRRKAAKRTFPWDMLAGELSLVSLPQAEDVPATKKPRLEELFSASTDEATAKLSSHDTAVSLPSATADHTDAESVKGSRATDHRRLQKNAELKSVVTNAGKKTYCKDYRTDWDAVAALVKLKDAVQTHGDKTRAAIATLVPGRAQLQSKCHNVLDPSINRKPGRTGTWTDDEVINLKAAVQTHGGKDWAAIAKLVPGRTKIQCSSRWHVLDPNIDRVSGRTGKWTAVEDSKLKHAVQTHGGKNWDRISTLVPGRAQLQCRNRWHNVLHANLDRTPGRTGTWIEDEVIQLKAAVQIHGGKDWAAIATLVPGRTRSQCWSRFKDVVESHLD
jgi:hypothetical protein